MFSLKLNVLRRFRDPLHVLEYLRQKNNDTSVSVVAIGCEVSEEVPDEEIFLPEDKEDDTDKDTQENWYGKNGTLVRSTTSQGDKPYVMFTTAQGKQLTEVTLEKMGLSKEEIQQLPAVPIFCQINSEIFLEMSVTNVNLV